MNDLTYLSDKYNIHNNNYYRLSIQVNPDGFSVLIADHDKNVLKLYHKNTGSYLGTYNEFKDNNELLPLTLMSFDSVSILINTHKISLVPAEFYSDDLKDFYYRINHPDIPGENVRSIDLPLFNNVLVFGINKELGDILRLFKNDPEISHVSLPYLTYLRKLYPEPDGMFLQASDNLMCISVYSAKGLIFHNYFRLTGQSDIIYHTMNTCRQLNRDLSSEKIYLSGSIVEDSEAMKLLKKYFSQLCHLPNELPFGLPWELNENYFTNLLEASNCVS